MWLYLINLCLFVAFVHKQDSRSAPHNRCSLLHNAGGCAKHQQIQSFVLRRTVLDIKQKEGGFKSHHIEQNSITNEYSLLFLETLCKLHKIPKQDGSWGMMMFIGDVLLTWNFAYGCVIVLCPFKVQLEYSRVATPVIVTFLTVTGEIILSQSRLSQSKNQRQCLWL